MRSLFQTRGLMRAALLAVSLLPGCGSNDQINAELATASLQASKARVKIYRTSGIVMSGPAARVRVDGKDVANLGVGGSTIIDLTAGSHKISVDAFAQPNEYTITFDAKAGTFYTLEVSPRGAAVVAGALAGVAGMLIEGAVNENGGGPFQIRVVDAKPAKH